MALFLCFYIFTFIRLGLDVQAAAAAAENEKVLFLSDLQVTRQQLHEAAGAQEALQRNLAEAEVRWGARQI